MCDPLGAGIDNWAKEAQAMGVMASSAVPFVTTDVRVAYAAAGASSGSFLRTNSTKGQVAAETLSALDPTDVKEPKSKKRSTPSA